MDFKTGAPNYSRQMLRTQPCLPRSTAQIFLTQLEQSLHQVAVPSLAGYVHGAHPSVVGVVGTNSLHLQKLSNLWSALMPSHPSSMGEREEGPLAMGRQSIRP